MSSPSQQGNKTVVVDDSTIVVQLTPEEKSALAWLEELNDKTEAECMATLRVCGVSYVLLRLLRKMASMQQPSVLTSVSATPRNQSGDDSSDRWLE